MIIRSDAAIRGSSRGMAVVFGVRSSLNSVLNRRRIVRLESFRESDGAYVWKRVFLKKGARRD